MAQSAPGQRRPRSGANARYWQAQFPPEQVSFTFR
jgi:hypothetical protein